MNDHVKLIHAVGINTQPNSPIEQLMLNLVRDLVELEHVADSQVLKTVTATYQTIYDQLLETVKEQ